MIQGNVSGIRKIHLAELEALVGKRSGSFCDPEILSVVCRISAAYRREIMLNLSRGGEVLDVTIGSIESVSGGRKSDRDGRLSGVRNLHTHPLGIAELSETDESCLRETRADALAVASVDESGNVTGCVTAYLAPDGIEKRYTADFSDPELTQKVLETDGLWKRARASSRRADAPKERAILVGVGASDADLRELAELARTAGAEIVDTITQSKAQSAATLIGSGKLEELDRLIQLRRADLVIFDNELGGGQAVRLENALGVKTLDRSNLILDIFAARAKSREGKLQVELAQLKYNLPRLLGGGAALDKQRGGIGMRGPGEKKLETDRRRIRDEIAKLERELAKLTKERNLRREKREKGALPQVALVGYTNAGKSTLMRALSKSEVYIADQLFATLDPVTRRVGEGADAFLLTDTVGFVSKLPHEFVDAFASTLEEARLADLLLVVLDLADPEREEKRRVVEETLVRIGADRNPRLVVYNKADLVVDPYFGWEPDSVTVSAATGERIDVLLAEIRSRVKGGRRNG